MNSPRTLFRRPSRLNPTFLLAWALFIMLTGSVLTGCARLKQYSIDSWPGPLPMQDLRYVQESP